MLLGLLLVLGATLAFKKKAIAAKQQVESFGSPRETGTGFGSTTRVDYIQVEEAATFYPEPTIMVYAPVDAGNNLGVQPLASLPVVMTEMGQTFIPPPPPPVNTTLPNVLVEPEIRTPKGNLVRPLIEFGGDRGSWAAYIKDLLMVASKVWRPFPDEYVPTPAEAIEQQLNRKEIDFLSYLQLRAISDNVVIPESYGIR